METAGNSIPFGYTPVWAEKDKYQVKSSANLEQRPIRMGLIGLGGVALGKHVPAIHRLRETGIAVEIVAGAEIDDGIRVKCERLHGLSCYRDFREMLATEELDAVEVLTDPGESRLQALTEVVDRGLHVFVEKPFLFLGVERLDESIARAREIVNRAHDKGLVVITGFVKHFSPPYMVAKQLIEAGAIGELSLVAIKMCQGWSRHILLEGQACHVLHIALWLAGPIAGVHAFGINRFAEPSYPYDNIVVNVEFDSGAIGTFYFNSSAPSLKPWERIEVFGERKWLAIEDGFSVSLHDTEEGPSKVWAPVMPHTLFFDEEFGGFAGEISALVEAVREGKQPPVTGKDGVDALILASMVHSSIRERRYVSWAEVVESADKWAKERV